MSDAPLRVTPHDILPGCGLAAYSFLLLGFFALGVTGLVLSTWSMLDAGDGAGVTSLTYGGNIPASQLKPLREAGLVRGTEVPDAYHPEAMDGSSACAIVSGEIVRLSPSEKIRFPLSDIKSVGGSDVAVEVVGPQSFVCYFFEGDGGDRFRRMIDPVKGKL